MANEVTTIIAAARAQGWNITPTKKGHWRCYAPDGVKIVILPSTPSDHRALQNAIAVMRQAGFSWKGR